jgi:hypothetical protein
MTLTKLTLLQIALAAIAGIGGLFVSEKVSPTKPGSLVTEAYAIIGRPLTPMSYAGVARRTTVVAPVMVAPVVVARPVVVVPVPVVVAPVCAQVVNAYGQIATVCR